LFLGRRNLVLDQPGVEDTTGVFSETINEENPPDQDFFFGKAVSFHNPTFWDKIKDSFYQTWVDIPIKSFQI